MQTKHTLYITWGKESSTFEKCFNNWVSYSQNFTNLNVLFFEDSDSDEPGIYPTKYHNRFIVGRKGYQGSRNSAYEHTNIWRRDELHKLNSKHRLIWQFLLENYNSNYFVYCNVTGLICLSCLSNVFSVLPKTSVFAGRPIYYIDRTLLYLGGSHLIFSRDILLELSDKLGYANLYEMNDILWGEILKQHTKIIMPVIDINTVEGEHTSILSAGRTLIDNASKKGHFQFRIKNTGSAATREAIDPILQFYAMCLSLNRNDRNTLSVIDLIRDYQISGLKHENLSVVSTRRR